MLVTTAGRRGTYTPGSLQRAMMGLDVFTSAYYAVFDPAVSDVTFNSAPSEVDGVLRYEMTRRDGLAVTEKLIRRGHIPELAVNGTSEFLGVLTTKCAHIRVPTHAHMLNAG
jgi:hypothetical protein